ncbi:MAG: D-alanyl-D-alanine carboxypeptidase/D-alanyl-D-alanine-endopeptidase [Planctomycetota bacterium]|jgi:D-alanyl-D-alanine carboxypeptidase/D-alanyl-D-alanine-endopeptidase (penicillin-binding protein 4)|nr:D-alanyl-D-alanine carboxypeptidase/D-alanyl-D-alanine-endopeptidase [Planctomycetota bacterium]
MRLTLALLIVALWPGCLPAADLSAQLRSLINAAPDGSRASIAVIDCATGKWVFQAEAERPQRIASVAKLLVSSAALLELGPDYQFTTTLVSLGPIVAGAAPGLGVIGGGSPCLDEHFSDKQPDRIFVAWATQLTHAGVQRIDGDLVVDNRLFAGPIRPSTYPDDHTNAQRWYSAPASAFAFNDNCIEVRVVPGVSGQAARVETRPRSNRIAINNRTTTVTSKPSPGLIVTRAHHANSLTVSGRYRKTSSWFPLAIHEDPDLLAGDHLAALLKDAGIPLSGTVRLGAMNPAAGPVLVTQHDPLLPALQILNQRSQNFYGEQILRVIGAHRTGSGSIAAGTEAVLGVLRADLGLALDSVTLLDGSGLSYNNRASAGDICRLLAAMDQGPHAEIFSGTLKDKWSGKVRARVKTGSLNVARCLAGYIPGQNSTNYAFAILLNKHSAKSIYWANTLRDKSFQAMAKALGGP